MSEQTDERASPGWTRDTHTEQQVWTHSSGGPLHVLVTSRQTLELQRHLVVSGSDTINSRDDQGETALHVAIATNCLEVRFEVYFCFNPIFGFGWGSSAPATTQATGATEITLIVSKFSGSAALVEWRG